MISLGRLPRPQIFLTGDSEPEKKIIAVKQQSMQKKATIAREEVGGCWLMMMKSDRKTKRSSTTASSSPKGASSSAKQPQTATPQIEEMIWIDGPDLRLSMAAHSLWRDKQTGKCDKSFGFRMSQFTGNPLYQSR
jgi:hypothetical protein